MTPIRQFISAVSVAVLLLGCASTPDEDPLANADTASGSDGSLSGSGMDGRYGQEGVIKPGAVGFDEQTNPAFQRPLDAVIYFEFDSAVLDDPSRSGRAPVPVSGIVRLLLELTFFAVAVGALFAVQSTTIGWLLGIAVCLHYALSYDRVRWLLRQ